MYDARYAGVRARLNRIWTRYKDCAGKSCRAPLPRSFQRTPAQEKAGTNRQSRGVQKRYGYWR